MGDEETTSVTIVSAIGPGPLVAAFTTAFATTASIAPSMSATVPTSLAPTAFTSAIPTSAVATPFSAPSLATAAISSTYSKRCGKP